MALEWPKHKTNERVFGAVVGVFDRRCFVDPHHEFDYPEVLEEMVTRDQPVEDPR